MDEPEPERQIREQPKVGCWVCFLSVATAAGISVAGSHSNLDLRQGDSLDALCGAIAIIGCVASIVLAARAEYWWKRSKQKIAIEQEAQTKRGRDGCMIYSVYVVSTWVICRVFVGLYAIFTQEREVGFLGTGWLFICLVTYFLLRWERGK